MQKDESSQVGGPASAGGRLASLDVFRGLVILTMIFVNYLGHVKNIPAWARHMPKETPDGYTFVDLVFPGFLFIVGVAIPFAVHRRMARARAPLALLRHVLFRFASLLFIGVIMVNNTPAFSAEATGMSRSLWFLLAMVLVVVFWAGDSARREERPSSTEPAAGAVPLAAEQRPRDGRSSATKGGLLELRFLRPPMSAGITKGVRIGAVLMLGGLLLIFRATNGAGEVVWIQHSWWGILGMIGWAYLICALAYLVFRGSSVAMLGMLGLLIALYIGDKHGVLSGAWLRPVRNLVDIGPVLGSTAASAMIGVLVGTYFVGEKSSLAAGVRARSILLLGVGLYFAGQLLRPLHGINKIAATDSYALVAGGICCLSFLFVYLLVDVAGWRKWAAPLVPIGQNALLAYILPGIVRDFFVVIGLPSALWPCDSGWAGAVNALVLTVLILSLTRAASRIGIRLKL